MLLNNRVIHQDNATLKDLSISLNNLFSEAKVLDFTSGEDYLYIGSDLPFNHRHFSLGAVPNGVTNVVSVEIWDGSQWRAAVDVLDLTSVGGKSLAQDGIIRWTTDRNRGWSSADTTERIEALATLKIYNMYWVRLSWSASLTGTTEIKYIGHKFSNDEDLGGYYPDLARSTTKTAFKTGKTDWNDQHILAGEEIIRDLRKKAIAWTPNKIIDWEVFNNAAVHKVAEIVYRALGDDYADNQIESRAAYDEAFDLVYFPVDRDEDGHIDSTERRPYIGLVRS